MDPVRKFYLDAMDVPVYVRREHAVEPVIAEPAPTIAVRSTAPTPSPEIGWEELQRLVAACTACELSTMRTQTVFGVGDPGARWMVVGEAPGAEEDARGEPFVGRAGQLLNAMLESAGAPRERVFIANTLKCRPPGNRDPAPAELGACRSFLDRQIELVQPELILVVGRIAAQALLDTDTAIGKLRGVVHRYGPREIPLVATYHPAYLLRSPGQKRRAWDDLKLALGVAAPIA
ncbi:MAG: uracil-DNA glycosylase [Xanthomonadaceae bacterium]|nr:uracil-DNA glycosylase [Xanthomonadaceae bacterium]